MSIVRRSAGVLLCACALIGPLVRPGAAQAGDPAAHPIDLATALRLAGAQNLDVQIARERVKEAEANRTTAREQFIPWLAPGIAWHRREGLAQASPSGIVGKAAFDAYSPGVGLTAQLAVGDAMYNSLAAKQLVAASMSAVEAQQDDAVLRAAEAYFDLSKAKALVGVVRDALATSEDYQRQIRDAVAIGIAFKGDELRVQSQSERYQVVLLQSLAQQRLAAVGLAKVLHLDAGIDLAPVDSALAPITLVDAAASVASLVERAMRARPDVRQSDAVIAATRASRSAAKYGPWIPSFGAQFFFGNLSGGPDSGHTRSGAMRDYSVGLNWRIGPGGLFDFGRLKASESRLAAAELNDVKLKDAVTADVVASLTRVRSFAAQIALAQRSLATANETLRLTRARKEFGVGIVLEDIQAQQAVTQARSDVITAIAEFNKAQYALNKAVGGAAGR